MASDLTDKAKKSLLFAQTYGRSADKLACKLNLTDEQARAAAYMFSSAYPDTPLLCRKDDDGTNTKTR